MHAKPSEASLIHRGKMVRERLLCETPPRPRADLSVNPSLTARERCVAHAEVEPCRCCHRLMNPIGFGFSSFDKVGRCRTEEADRPVDAHGEILGTAHSDGNFDDLEGLATQLAASPDVQACFTERWTRWASGLGRDDGLRGAGGCSRRSRARSTWQCTVCQGRALWALTVASAATRASRSAARDSL